MALGKMEGWVKWHWVKWNWVNCHVTLLDGYKRTAKFSLKLRKRKIVKLIFVLHAIPSRVVLVSEVTRDMHRKMKHEKLTYLKLINNRVPTKTASFLPNFRFQSKKSNTQ